MQLERNPKHQNRYAVALESNTEAYDFSRGLGVIRSAWVRYRDTQKGPILVHLRESTLIKTGVELQRLADVALGGCDIQREQILKEQGVDSKKIAPVLAKMAQQIAEVTGQTEPDSLSPENPGESLLQ